MKSMCKKVFDDSLCYSKKLLLSIFLCVHSIYVIMLMTNIILIYNRLYRKWIANNKC